jgi:hypothetical protein
MDIKKVLFALAPLTLVVLGVFVPQPVRAEVQVGLLTCHSPEPSTYVIASAHSYRCVFNPVAGARQYYVARAYRFGAEIGISNNTGLAWLVFAPSPRVGPGALAGNYAGVSAGAAVLVGARASGLVGGLPNAFTLQPVSVEGEMGMNVVATVTGLALTALEPRRQLRRHQRQ